MKVLFVASECAPLVKVGGLGDVIGALPKALVHEGVEVAVAIPFYQQIKSDITTRKLAVELGHEFDKFEVEFEGNKHPVYVSQTFLPGSHVPVFLFENETYLASGPYGEDGVGQERRFTFFCAAVIAWDKVSQFDVLHCHDKHSAFLCKEAKMKKSPVKTVLTIHNASSQGSPETGLLAGIQFADFVTTVSPQYAKEILTPEFGEGLETELAKRKSQGQLEGVLNGIDLEAWDPRTDSYLKVKMTSQNVEDFKRDNREQVREKFSLTGQEGAPIFVSIGRMSPQKGFDVLAEGWRAFVKGGGEGSLVIQGQGDGEILANLKKLEEENQNGHKRVAIYQEFSEETAHLLYAGADFFLMPSRFEPCGLTQMISMRYGTVPVVSDVGGLHDTVIDEETGIVFAKAETGDLLEALNRATDLYKGENYARMRQSIIAADWSWDKSAKTYRDIYDRISRK